MHPELAHLADWLERHASWVLLLVVELLLVGVVGLPFLLHNNLLSHDLVGHLASAAFTDEFLFPTASGYNPFFYAGAPQNLLYPPMLAYSSAALGRVIGLQSALKLIIVTAVAATPVTVYWCARAHALSRMPAAIATVVITALLAIDSRELGGNFLSTFEIGNATNALGLPLFLAYAAAVARLREQPNAVLLPTLLLGLNLITHLVGGMVAIALLATHLVYGARERSMARLLFHGLWAFLLAAFFVVPLLAYQRYGSPDNRSFNQYPDSLLLLLASVGVLLSWFACRQPNRELIGPLASLCGMLLLLRGFVFNDVFPRGWGLHVHRFKLYDAVLLPLIAVWLMDGWSAAWPARRRTGLGLTASSIAAVGLVAGLWQIDARGTSAQTVPHLPRLNSRVMVVSSPEHQVSDHALQHLVPMRTGNLVGKGLFVELAANGRFLVDLELLLAKDPFSVRTWGVELDPLERLETLRPELLKLLDLFGFGYVLANEPLRADAGLLPMRDLGDGFTLYRANYAELAEVWTKPLDSVPTGQFVQQNERWFFGKHDRITVGLLPGQPPLRPVDAATLAKARVTAAQVSSRDQSIALDIAAEAPVPVLVKFTYAPQFNAFDASGQSLPLYRVTPNFMLVIGKGHVTLRYQHTALQRWTTVVSAGALLLWLGLAARRAILRLSVRRAHG